MSQDRWYPAGSASASGSVVDQGSPNNDANAWPVRITDGTHDATVTAGGALNVAIASGITNPLPVTGPLTDTQLRASAVPVSAASLPLPTGASTAANQATEIASLASIDSKLTSPITVTGPLTDAQLRATPVPVSGTVSTGGLTDTQLRASPVPVSLTSTTITGSVAVTGPLTDTQLRATPVPVSGTVTANAGTGTFAISAASLPLPTGAATESTLAAFSAKSASAAVHEAFDYQAIAYVGATQKIDTVTYKTGGSGGTTVATLTMAYDGSDRLTSVTKT